MIKKTLKINGVERILILDKDETLAQVLREHLLLTGCKIGCGEGHCGACNVIMNGKVTRSCIYKMSRVPDNAEITTIEGVGTISDMHPIQVAWMAYGCAQCGFCSPGFIISAKVLLDNNPSPTREEVRDWFNKQRNLCRCTGYKPLIDATMAAAAVMRGEMTKEDLVFKQTGDSIVGTNYIRPSAAQKVTGTWDFGADDALKMPEGTLRLALTQAKVSHANILSIDTTEAESMPGVVRVITAKDIKAAGGTNKINGLVMLPKHNKTDGFERPVLCDEKIFQFGDAIAIVAADTEAHSKNMKLAAQDGSLPEIVHLDSAEAPKYNEAGYLLDMSDFLKENKDIDDALDGMEDAFNDGKVQYGLPYQSNVQGFFYNKDLFDKAGIAYPTDDTTYDEFLDMIAKLKDSGVTPIAIGSKNSGYSMWEFNEFFSRYGWEDNEKSYTGDKAKYSNDDMNACFEKIKGLADAGAFPENMATIEYFDAKQLFNEGKAAMFGTGQWDCAEFDKNIGEHIGFWWGPKFEDSSYEQNIAMKVPAAPLVVSSAVKDNDKAKEAVYAFLKYYYGEEAAKISYEGSIFPATNYDGIAATDSQYAMNAMITALGNGWKTPKAAPDQTVTPAVQEAMYDAIFGVMQGTYSPKDALKNMDSAAAN